MGNEIEKKSYLSFTVILRYLGASSCDYFVDNLQKKNVCRNLGWPLWCSQTMPEPGV